MRSSIISALTALRLDGAARAAHASASRALGRVRGAAGGVGDSLSRARTSIVSYPARRKTARGYRRLVSRGVRLEPLSGDASASSIPVVICMWRRPERIAAVLDMLDSQKDCPPVRLVLWNNDPSTSPHIRSVIQKFSKSGSLGSIELYDSAINVGGVGRFLAIRELRRQGIGASMIMLDDDQDVSPQFVRDLIAVAAPHTISGVWAWRIHTGYWDRTQVVSQGESADYVGTGGSICDSDLIADPRFLGDLPSRFLFMEDLWMSRVAAGHGWSLRMVDSPVSFVLAELDQGHSLHRQKEEFYDWLVSRNSGTTALPD